MVAGYIEYDPMLARNHTLPHIFFPPRYVWALVDLVRKDIFANRTVRLFSTRDMQSLRFPFSREETWTQMREVKRDLRNRLSPLLHLSDGME